MTKVFLDDDDQVVKEIKASNLNNSSIHNKIQKVPTNKEKPPGIYKSPNKIVKSYLESDTRTKIDKTNPKASSSKKFSIVDNTLSTNDQLLNNQTRISRSSKSKNNPLKEYYSLLNILDLT